jgi:hypothetical protein
MLTIVAIVAQAVQGRLIAGGRFGDPGFWLSQDHFSIDRDFGYIRKRAATDAATYEGAQLREGPKTSHF